MSPRTGRPPTENPKTDRFNIRVTQKKKKYILDFSKETGKGLLELIRIGIKTVKEKEK